MKIRGNNVLFFAIEVISGILVLILTKFYGDIGLLGMIPFFIGLILIHNIPDERETGLLFKASALRASFLGAIMAILYFKFPGFNLFYGYASFGMITRGLIGIFYFLKS